MMIAVMVAAAAALRPPVQPHVAPMTHARMPAVAKPAPALASKLLGATAAFAPMVAFAADVVANEDLDYGSVSAPSWILPAGAAAAILTALLPVVLQSGDDAAREMQERDKDSFGKEFADSVTKKRDR